MLRGKARQTRKGDSGRLMDGFLTANSLYTECSQSPTENFACLMDGWANTWVNSCVNDP